MFGYNVYLFFNGRRSFKTPGASAPQTAEEANMKNYLLPAILAVFTWFVVPQSAQACSETNINACPPTTAPVVTFKGDRQLADPIVVWVCHPYWEQLNGIEGEKDDPNARWWGPTIKYGRWQANLPATYERCKRFEVKPGTQITTNASCLDGALITTGPMTVAGRIYLMDLPK
jgi:hypothetical protein